MPADQRIAQYVDIVTSTGMFNGEEVAVLEEILNDYYTNPKTTYVLFDTVVDGITVGFVFFGKTPLTERCWDIYWIAVRGHCQGKGYGMELLKRAEQYILNHDGNAVIRIETSTRRQYDHARRLYERQGYREAGRIPAFYGCDDDLVIYYRGVEQESLNPGDEQ